jgi:hypothetical protein
MNLRARLIAALVAVPTLWAGPVTLEEPTDDRWMYGANATPGTRSQASTFSPLPAFGGAPDRWGFFLIGFDTSQAVPAGLPPSSYRIRSVTLTAVTGQEGTFLYDPSYDSYQTYGTPDRAPSVPDADPGRPVELHGAGFRNSASALTFTETSDYGSPQRSAYPLGFDPAGEPRDISNHITQSFESRPWAVGQTTDAAAGSPVGIESVFTFDIEVSQPGVGDYLRTSLSQGRLWLSLSSLHPAIQQGGRLASWLTKEDAIHQLFGDLAPQLTLDVELDLPLTLSRQPDGIQLSWPQFADFTFELQASENLSPGSWQTLQVTPASDDTPGSFLDTSGLPTRFYRLQILPTS